MIQVKDGDKVSILFSELTPKHIIGFSTDPTYKGFLKFHRLSGSYELVAVDDMTNGNRWTIAYKNKPTFYDAIEFLKQNNFEVYCFDSVKELLAWLAK